MVAAGFVGVEVLTRIDVYANASQSSSAAKFGTLGITFQASKPGDSLNDDGSRRDNVLKN